MATRPKNILLLNRSWLVPELRALGYRVLSAGIEPDNVHLPLPDKPTSLDEIYQVLPDDFQPDRIVYFDNGSSVKILGLEESTTPKIFVSVDTIIHQHWHPSFAALFDSILVAQPGYVTRFETLSAPVTPFLPWATGTTSAEVPRSIPVLFTGSLNPLAHPGRKELMQRIQADVPLTILDNYSAEHLSQAKIALCPADQGQLTMRLAESAARGACIASVGFEQLPYFLKPGSDLVTYFDDSIENGIKLIKELLADDPRRLQLASAAQARVETNHMAKHRAVQLATIIEEMSTDAKPRLLAGAVETYLNSFMTQRYDHERDAEVYLVRAVQLLAKLFSQHAPNREEVGLAIIAAHLLNEQRLYDRSIAFFEEVLGYLPEEKILLAAFIKTLVASGAKGRARALAAPHSRDVDALLSNIDERFKVALEAWRGLEEITF